ncbi:unnamed protein product [Trichobilharzia regenti]|nr:unnamed protein product [Trichobilharzia regenti]
MLRDELKEAEIRDYVPSRWLKNKALCVKDKSTSLDTIYCGTNGGLLVEIQGVGMDAEKSTVTICEQPCTLAGGSSLTLKCITPKITTQSVKSCDVVVTVPTNVGVLQKTLSSAFVYDPKLTPTVVSVDPLIGGTGGGTNLTLIGIMFDESTKVSVGGTQCQIISINDTTITCQTGVYNRSEKVPIDVITGKYGKASGVSP